MKTKLHIQVDQLTPAELVTGIKVQNKTHCCVVCGMTFQEGVIYPYEDQLLDARLAAERHVQTVHDGMLQVLLALPKTINGLTDIQRQVLEGWSDNLTDREIARTLGGKAESTIRNHRFQFKKRVTEARILVALSELLERREDKKMEFIKYHQDIPMQDDRIMTTLAEAEKIMGRCFSDTAAPVLSRFPKKEKEKLVALKRITQEFDKTRTYSEKEVNVVLKPIFADFVTIRRYLIEYRFLCRKPDGSQYWVNA